MRTRFDSNRTDYGKLSERVKHCVSGAAGATIALTPIQRWKLNRWSFVAPYIKKRRQPRNVEMGKVSICNNLQMMFTLISILLVPSLTFHDIPYYA